MNAEQLNKLKELLALATGGPWELRMDDEGRSAIAHPGGWVLESETDTQDAYDNGLIVALRNAAPELIAAASRSLSSVGAAGVATAEVYPPDGTVSPFTVINLGSGRVKIGDSIHDDRLPALWFGKDGLGMGVEQSLNRRAEEGETIAVVTFSNVEGLEVLLDVVQRIRREKFPESVAPAPATAKQEPVGVDPAEPRDDSDRTFTKPIGYVSAADLNRVAAGHDASMRSARFGPSALDGDIPVYIDPPAIQQPQPADDLTADSRDAARLDFMVKNSAWIQWAEFDHPQKRAQVWTQNEDEEYIILSGIDKSFGTYREAIDAAMSSPSNTHGSEGERNG